MKVIVVLIILATKFHINQQRQWARDSAFLYQLNLHSDICFQWEWNNIHWKRWRGGATNLHQKGEWENEGSGSESHGNAEIHHRHKQADIPKQKLHVYVCVHTHTHKEKKKGFLFLIGSVSSLLCFYKLERLAHHTNFQKMWWVETGKKRLGGGANNMREWVKWKQV